MTQESLATFIDSYAPEGASTVERALNTDPILAAEKLTGKSYKEDKETDSLGMFLHMEHAQAKAKILEEAGDTHYNSPLDQYLAVTERLGFTVVSKRPFAYNEHRDDPTTLHHFVLVHPGGAILIFDTYRWGQEPEKVNGGKLLYNWKPNALYREMQRASHDHYKTERELKEAIEVRRRENGDTTALEERLAAHLALPVPPMPPHVTSSGGYEYPDPDVPMMIPNPDYVGDEEARKLHCCDLRANALIDNPERDPDKYVYVGYHDCREGLAYNFSRLCEWGDFVTPWIEMPYPTGTLDLVESKDRYYHSMWPPRSKYDERIDGESEQPKGLEQNGYFNEAAYTLPVQFERLAHEIVGHLIEIEDHRRWPQEMIEIVGDAAWRREMAKDNDRIVKEAERFGFDALDIYARAGELYKQGTPSLKRR